MSQPLDAPHWPRGYCRLLIHSWIWKMAWRDSRRERKRLAVFAGSIVIGICALVTIHALRATMEDGVALQSRELLGSDLQIVSRQPLDRELIELTLDDVLEAVDYETVFTTMLRFAEVDQARLVQVRASGGHYPFYGTMDVEPASAWERMRGDAPVIYMEAPLLEQFGATVGSYVILGEALLPVTARVVKPAPRVGRFGVFAPDVYVNAAALEASELMAQASLARYYTHLRLINGADPDAVADRVRAVSARAGLRFETPVSRQEQVGDVLDRFEQFLSLLALFSLILGAIGVASAMQAQIARRQPSIAILRCLGVPPRAAFMIYLIQAAVLGLVGTFVGVLLAVLLHVGVVGAFQDVLPIALTLVPDGGVVLRTALIGLAACIGFALLPLQQIRDIPPLAVLRASVNPARRKRMRMRALPIYVFLFAVLVVISVLSSTNLWQGFLLPIGLVVVFLLLALVGQGLIRVARQIARGPIGYIARQGISNLFRPNNQTLVFVVSLGLGILLLSLTLLLRALLVDRIEQVTQANGPSIFLVDVQADQVEGVGSLLKSWNLPVLESAPMVTMRVQAIEAVGAAELRRQESVPGWILRREFRSSYRDHLNATETEVAGIWPPEDWRGEEPVPLSLEVGLAEDMGVAIGSRLTIDVQGMPLETEVTHLRRVDWSQFNLNFFMLFPSGVLEGAPGFHVVTTRIPEGQSSGQFQGAVAYKFQNVSVIDLSSILATVRNVLSRVSQGIHLLSLFTVGAGLCILVGIFLNGREQRRHEAVLLRTLGASTRQLRMIFCIEFGALGLLAALAGGLLAVAAYVPLAHYAFSLTPVFPVASLLTLLLAACGLSVLMGALLSRGTTSAPPLSILQKE